MFRKLNGRVLLGVLLIVLGVGIFGFYYQKNAPSPFDVVDTTTQDAGFLPIIIPDSPVLPAPTVSAVAPVTRPDAAPSGLIPDRLVIPAILLDAPVLPVTSREIESGGVTYQQWHVPAEFAVGWQDGSALLGLPGNTVLNGHHNAYGMVFKNLAKLNVGDEIIIYSAGVEYHYRVAEKLILPERGQTLATRLENARWIQSSLDERLTLVTCWPATSNTHRVIIVAFPVEPSPVDPVEDSSGY